MIELMQSLAQNKASKMLKTAAFLLMFNLTACRSGDGHHHDNYNDSPLTPVQNPLRLQSFDIVDTQGRSSERYADSLLSVDYRNNLGDFDLTWKADFGSNYRATLLLSPSGLARDGRQIDYQYCGYGQDCGFTGASYCNYGSDYQVVCGNNSSVYVGNWLTSSNRNLFIVLQLCDTRTLRCYEDSHEVDFY